MKWLLEATRNSGSTVGGQGSSDKGLKLMKMNKMSMSQKGPLATRYRGYSKLRIFDSQELRFYNIQSIAKAQLSARVSLLIYSSIILNLLKFKFTSAGDRVGGIWPHNNGIFQPKRWHIYQNCPDNNSMSLYSLFQANLRWWLM